MSTGYTLYVKAQQSTLSQHFQDSLSVELVYPDTNSPLHQIDRIWMSIETDTDGDWDDEAELLETSNLTIVSFIPSKTLKWADELDLLRSVMSSIVDFDSVHDTPFLFAVFDRLTLQRLPKGSLTVDASFVDNRGEFNADSAFDPLLSSAATDDIDREI